MEYLLYGLSKDNKERYMEDILTVSDNMARIDTIKAIAKKDGFHSFRVATYSGEAPDFTNVLNNL